MPRPSQGSSKPGEKTRREPGNGSGREWTGRQGNGEGQKLTASSPDIHRALPHSVEAEQGVLGSMLISPQDKIAEVVAKINDSYFYIPAHQTIYRLLVELWDAKQGIDLITFTQALRDRNLLETVGGASFVTNLFTFVPTAANLTYYLEIVRDKYILREIIAACTEGARRSYEDQDEVDNLLDEVEQRIYAVGEDRFKGDSLTMKEQVLEAIETINKLWEQKGSLTGLPTGFVEFDRMTSGLHPAEMVVIAARPSMGKTAFVMNIVEHVAVHEKKPVGVFSLEMSAQQLVQRMLCSRARVNLRKARDGFLADSDFDRIATAAGKLAEADIYIDDTPGLSILELRAKARRLKSRHDLSLIVIDYLQLLRSTSRRGQDNRQIEISEISAGIKGLSKELNIPIVVAAQLNRNPESRTGDSKGRPRLSDLRESGSIEQDADLVGLLVRQEYYADTEEEKDEFEGKAELIIAKQRNGPTGDVPLTFIKEVTRFEDRAREEREPI
jgi:replicative DNA helicase